MDSNVTSILLFHLCLYPENVLSKTSYRTFGTTSIIKTSRVTIQKFGGP